MATYTLRIKWDGVEETLTINPKTVTAGGDDIITYERWPGYDCPTEYRVKIIDKKKIRTTYTMRLLYERSNNSGQALENTSWGVSTIALNTTQNSATATWATNPSNANWDGDADVEVFSEDLYEDLGYEHQMRRKRKQEVLRKSLLRINPVCALSQEKTIDALEAAHIVDVESKGNFRENNGILLRADIHKLFDRGVISIDDEGFAVLQPGAILSRRYLEELSLWKLQPDELVRVTAALNRRRALPSAA